MMINNLSRNSDNVFKDKFGHFILVAKHDIGPGQSLGVWVLENHSGFDGFGEVFFGVFENDEVHIAKKYLSSDSQRRWLEYLESKQVKDPTSSGEQMP